MSNFGARQRCACGCGKPIPRRNVQVGLLYVQGHQSKPLLPGDRVVNPYGLTTAEMGMVREVSEGLSNREIAARCHISKETVTRHLHTIFDKTGVSSRLELALFALNHDLVDLCAVSPAAKALKGSLEAAEQLAERYRLRCDELETRNKYAIGRAFDSEAKLQNRTTQLRKMRQELWEAHGEIRALRGHVAAPTEEVMVEF